MNRVLPARTLIQAFVLLSVPLMAPGCSAIPATGDSGFTPFMSPEEESRIGEAEHKRIVAEHNGIYRDPQLQAYVDAVGRRIAEVTETPDAAFRFTILDTIAANAYALPGGYIYVTRGLLALLEDEAELAGILAHEIAHVTSRHAAQAYSSKTASSVSFMILSVLTAGLSEIVERGAKYYFRSYGRDQEREADAIGLTYLQRGKYDPRGLQRALSRMREYDALTIESIHRERAGEGSGLSTHPAVEERAATLESTIAESREIGPWRRGRDDYLARIDGLPLFFHALKGIARIRLVEAGNATSVDIIAGDPSAAVDESWINVLNGLAPGQRVRRGERIKTVVFESKDR